MYSLTHRSSIRPKHPILLLFLLIFATFTLYGCNTSTASHPTPSPNSTTSQVLGDNDSEKSLDNLNTFRGSFVFGHEVRSFTLCGSSEELWVFDETNGDARAIHEAMTNAPYQPIFMEIRGMLTDAPSDGFGAEYSGGIVFKEVIHASQIEESWGCREKYGEFIFKAQGNEPGWSVVIRQDDILFSTVGMVTKGFPKVPPSRSETSTTYESNSYYHSLNVVITRARCLDTMSDEIFGWTAQATFDGKTYTGCAKQGDQRPQ